MQGTRSWALALSLVASLASCAAVTFAAAGTAGAAVTTPAASAPAAAQPAVQSVRTWREAQKAARFRLVSPKRTYGLRQFGSIMVAPCNVRGAAKSRRDVLAIYGPRGNHVIYLDQNDHGKLCSAASLPVTSLGTFRIDGVKARLDGVCGKKGEPSCRSRNIVLLVTWKKNGKFYQVSARDESRHVALGFASGLRPVR